MKEVTRNLLVGLFVVVSLGALSILMVWFGETPSWLRTGEWELRITGVRELGGIGEGSPVNLSGVEIGRVKRLEFVDTTRPDQGVDIVAGIKRDYYVPRGGTVRVYGATLGFGTGRVDIIVERGASAVPLPKDGTAEMPGEMRSVVGELISKDMVSSLERTITHIGNLTAEWTPVGTNLAELLEQRSVESVSQPSARQRGVTPNLSTVLDRLDRLVKHINTVLGDENLQEDVKTVVKDLKDSSGELKEMIHAWRSETEQIAENVSAGIERTEQNLDKAFANLNEVLEQLDESVRTIVAVLQHVESGEGTAGLFVRDERLYEAAVLAIERFSEVMLNLKIISGKIKEDGYITVGKAPTGFPRKSYPIAPQATGVE
ncbi:MAG: MlaD family protein [Planctomycetota bacterium]|jgi:ABC-type transporter Mla subunit MlaD